MSDADDQHDDDASEEVYREIHDCVLTIVENLRAQPADSLLTTTQLVALLLSVAVNLRAFAPVASKDCEDAILTVMASLSIQAAAEVVQQTKDAIAAAAAPSFDARYPAQRPRRPCVRAPAWIRHLLFWRHR